MLTRFGLGQKTGVGLPGESPGSVPPMATWSGSTFGNLPIGQGLSMTVLQMAGMYQAVANNGLRIPPRIVEATVSPDGAAHRAARARGGAGGVRRRRPRRCGRCSPRSRRTSTTSAAPGPRPPSPATRWRARPARRSRSNPACGCYASSTYWITFAGMFPAQDPRYVIGIMLDAPAGGTSAAPLFHDIATYLAQRDQHPAHGQPHAAADAPTALTTRCRRLRDSPWRKRRLAVTEIGDSPGRGPGGGGRVQVVGGPPVASAPCPPPALLRSPPPPRPPPPHDRTRSARCRSMSSPPSSATEDHRFAVDRRDGGHRGDPAGVRRAARRPVRRAARAPARTAPGSPPRRSPPARSRCSPTRPGARRRARAAGAPGAGRTPTRGRCSAPCAAPVYGDPTAPARA